MHIPDGLMDPNVALLGWIEFVVAMAIALFISKGSLKEKDLPKLAVLSAGVFVAQMLNFPIGGGTTGHLIGGALMAIMVGPVAAMIGMTVILAIQGLMFGDGGITALGLNAVNMAVIAPLSGWGVYTLMRHVLVRGKAQTDGKLDPGLTLAIAAGAWGSVFLAAAACTAELAVSYAVSGGAYGIAASVSVPAMLGYHAIIGVGEAVITATIVSYVWYTAPEAFSRRLDKAEPRTGLMGFLSSNIAKATLAVLVVFALALPLYFMYSADGEDGLEATMTESGVEEGDAIIESPFSYGENYFAALFAGVLGFVATALASIGLLRLMGGAKTMD
ncbi:MAG: energy-coupling factor ABC transporter permease [Thermoplasmata archaeon]|nr:energy-coupling factor ABC transporter permease [Thermoplasmata archaeon]